LETPLEKRLEKHLETQLTQTRADFFYPLLVCDIGGTNLRVARVEERGGSLRQVLNAPIASQTSLAGAIETVQAREKIPARSLVVCAAGPLDGARVKLTNADWIIDGPQLAASLGLDQGLLLNDFEAQAIALPHLPGGSTRAIGAVSKPDETATHLVLGPGTGLGAAALLRAKDAWLPVATEAGHASFGPSDAAEERIWPHLERVAGRVTFESVLSGPGLKRLYAAVRAANGLEPLARAAPDIVEAARAGEAAAIETLKLFWRLTARCAGDLALVFLARGGVTLAGGILPRLVDWLDEDDFRRAFAAKPPMAALLAAIPVRLLTEPGAVLTGLAALAADPDSCALDYRRRLWRP
jgi:glucokinase